MSPLAAARLRLARLSLDPLARPVLLLPARRVRSPGSGSWSPVRRPAWAGRRPSGSRPRGRRCSRSPVARTSSRRSRRRSPPAAARRTRCRATSPTPTRSMRSPTTSWTRFGGVDVLVNNAGHSIRRSAADTAERPYDHDRLMRLNYHAPVRLTLNLLESMREQGGGQIINSSTWGVPGGLMPMFTAYHASKAALAAFSRSLQAEERRHGILITSLHFPLMRTPMIAPTEEVRRPRGARARGRGGLGRARRPAPAGRDDAGLRHHARCREAGLAAARGASGAVCPPLAARRGSTKGRCVTRARRAALGAQRATRRAAPSPRSTTRATSDPDVERHRVRRRRPQKKQPSRWLIFAGFGMILAGLAVLGVGRVAVLGHQLGLRAAPGEGRRAAPGQLGRRQRQRPHRLRAGERHPPRAAVG